MGGLKRRNAPSVRSDGTTTLAEKTSSDSVDTLLSQEISKINMRSVADGDIVVHRATFCSYLTVPKTVLFQQFRKPTPSGWKMPLKERALVSGRKQSGRPCLGMTRKLKPITVCKGFRTVKPSEPNPMDAAEDGDSEEEEDVVDELAIQYEKNPIILWESDETPHQIIIDPVIGKYLRDHQREGVKFLFECVCGLREFNGQGCILADDMGLGKTLQSITLLYTMLYKGFTPDNPICKRVIVCTPTALVGNWYKEIDKWLKTRVKALAVIESSRKEVIKMVKQFTNTKRYQVLIISYDTFRIHSKLFAAEDSCDLLICDEAHRLKNEQTLTSKALDSLKCRRRILLSGTPMQNHLEEFYAMVKFCNPDLLGTLSNFRKVYQTPILNGREPDATDNEIKKSKERSDQLSQLVAQFILRRTNSLLSKHLPPKLTQVVCVKMSKMQKMMYNHFLTSKQVKDLVKDPDNRRTAATLSSINSLKKICNHPQLLYKQPKMYANPATMTKKQQTDHENAVNIASLFPEGFGNTSRRGGRRGQSAPTGPTISNSNCEWSGKFLLMANMLRILRMETTDRIVVVSNYTQTLDVMSNLCEENSYPYVRLDGSTSGKKRQGMVDRLNDPNQDVFVFLLSSKAGGCGLNLIGANRLVLFDPDWNPATDKQAAARVWRDGQKKRSYVYRFVAAGSIEEKIFQRQLSKEGLQGVVDDEQNLESAFSTKDLKDLFRLREGTISDTHDKYKCNRCSKAQVDSFANSILDGDVKDSGIDISTIERYSAYLAENPEQQPANPIHSTPKPNNRFGRGRSKFQTPLSKPKNTAGSMSVKPDKRDSNAPKPDTPQLGFPGEGDLNEWSHHLGADTVDDYVLRKAGKGLVTFAFGQAIDGQSLALLAQEKARALAMETPKRQKTDDESSTQSTSCGDSDSVHSLNSDDEAKNDIIVDENEKKDMNIMDTNEQSVDEKPSSE